MFILSELEDFVRIKPSELWKPRADAVTDVLHKKYANKVVHDLGLCIQLFDLISIGEAIVHACQDGSYQSKVVFRLIVFRPFIDEIITGTIVSSSQEGIRVTLGFFSDILIPSHRMRPDTFFDIKESIWVWKFQTDESEPATELFFDKGLDIRFRVNEIKFIDVGSKEQDKQQRIMGGRAIEDEELDSPMHLVGDVSEDGLGVCSWWES